MHNGIKLFTDDYSPRKSMEDLRKSSLKVENRIEVAVLNFLRILTSPDPAISHLPLVTIFLRNFNQKINLND